MRKYCITFPAYSFLFLLSACGAAKKTAKPKDIIPGTWQSTPIAIDGDSKDWPSPYPNYDSKSKIAYATANDGKYLYVTMETGDELTQIKILKAGMAVSIDTGGNKTPIFTIKYPLPNENLDLEMPQMGNSDKNAAVHTARQVSQYVHKAIEQANQYAIEGFNTCDGGYMVAQINTCGIKVKARLDEYKELVWEAAIPLKALYHVDSLSATSAGKPISICFNITGLKAPKGKGVDNVNGNMNSGMGGQGGQHNSMQGGGGRQVRQQDNPLEHLYNATKTWKQTGLAVHP